MNLAVIKRSAKFLAHWFCILLILPFFLSFIIFKVLGTADASLSAHSQFLSLFPGKVGAYLRAAFYRLALRHCDAHALISFGTILSQTDTSIGSGVYIGPQCNIGKCEIGNDTLLGSGVHIMSGKQQHNFEDLNTPIREQGGAFSLIRIGKDCWIGNGALIMANVGDKSIVAAGSVVTSDVPAKSIVAGNPAKVVKCR